LQPASSSSSVPGEAFGMSDPKIATEPLRQATLEWLGADEIVPRARPASCLLPARWQAGVEVVGGKWVA
jgi:hypothetical protein